MPKKEYGWDHGNIPIIGAHSLAKHRILRAYVQRYIEILTRNPRIERLKLTLVDGFAGGGIYARPGETEPHFGSPAILIEATAAAQLRVNQGRRKPVVLDAEYVFIDVNPTNLAVLKDTLQKHICPQHPGVAPKILPGTFEENLAPVVDSIKRSGQARRAIFVLDQYGYTDVPLASMQLIFGELPKAEVFLTLAVGWIAAYLRNAADARDVVQKALGIRREATDEEIEEHLLTTDGSGAKLRVVQQLLHDAFVQRSGAQFATPFFILSRESHRPYWFLHLANSPRANDVVKELHWESHNHFSHYGDAGLAMLGFDPYREPDPQQLSFGFDAIAKQRTEQALLRELPKRIGVRHANGIAFSELFAAITNETPATKEILRSALTTLCREGDIAKVGGSGEQRHPETPIRDDDVVSKPVQTRIPWPKR